MVLIFLDTLITVIIININKYVIIILYYSCFRTIGEKYVWDELIFPGMSESIYTVLQASMDASFYRPKSFHLFGADFVITQNYIPYLIEINSIPGLNPSTSIIANLVPTLLEDIVKGIHVVNFKVKAYPRHCQGQF